MGCTFQPRRVALPGNDFWGPAGIVAAGPTGKGNSRTPSAGIFVDPALCRTPGIVLVTRAEKDKKSRLILVETASGNSARDLGEVYAESLQYSPDGKQLAAIVAKARAGRDAKGGWQRSQEIVRRWDRGREKTAADRNARWRCNPVFARRPNPGCRERRISSTAGHRLKSRIASASTWIAAGD